MSERDVAQEVLSELEEWLRLPPRQYAASVHLFARRLPREMLLDAVYLAMSRLPEGDQDSFRYFCGVCWSMIRERRLAVILN